MTEPARAIDRIIREHIGDEETVFVFPSEMAASAYADRALGDSIPVGNGQGGRRPSSGGRRIISGGRRTISMERFIAWDSFLEEAVLPHQKDRTAVSDVMRKMFAAMVLDENARRAQQNEAPLFRSIIYPQYARYSSSFTAWVAGILPQLRIWAESVAGTTIEQIDGVVGDFLSPKGNRSPSSSDAPKGLHGRWEDAPHYDEACDFRTLIARYKAFLADNNLFESAWERPPFTHNGKRYVLFFTEALADFPLYRTLLLAASPHVTIAKTPALGADEAAAVPEAAALVPFKTYFLKNAKSETTAAALFIMNLHENGVAYGEITVTSPDLETYEPYILDACAAHGIPVQNGSGKPLSSYPAGRLFSALSTCVSKKMAVPTVSALLLNRSIPWKEEAVIDALIAYGLENNCICSWEAEDGGPVDVWEHAFEKRPPLLRLRTFYRDLKHAAQGLCSATRFAAIRDRYFAFRDTFIDVGKFQIEASGYGTPANAAYNEANIVLGRCIAELSALIQIEKHFPQIKVPSPWQFYTSHLDSTIYKTQSASDGVMLLPYRVSASVPSVCHIVLGANQNAMPQIFRELSFLSGVKKRRLHIEDVDASAVFFTLHRFSSARRAVFFCSEETFTGFALPYNGLGLLNNKPESLASVLAADAVSEGDFHASYYEEEARRFEAVADNTPEAGDVSRFFALQKRGFDAFAVRHESPAAEGGLFSESAAGIGGITGIKERIAARYVKDNRLVVSASALLPYYQCAFFWLFRNVYRLEEVDAETSLMSPFARGNIYHDVMKRVFTAIKEQNLPLGLTETAGVPDVFQSLLAASTDDAFAALALRESGESALTETLLLPQKEAVLEKCRVLFERMLKKFEGWTVAEVEPEPEWEMSGANWTLAGRPDLLLRDEADGTYGIVDFKSGKTPSKSDCTNTEGEGVKNFQLPLYHTLAENRGFVPADAGFFIGIKEAKIDQMFYPPSEDAPQGGGKPSFAAVAEDVDEKTRRYVREVLDVDFENSCNEKYGACLRCDYRRLCRTTFTVQRETRIGRKRYAH
ncbi:MAG: PD-(D/E)XK nuclease family protein [Spirochaetaceae bacterium]|jgi:hypothetical protein|nr:PD-(D/E)XK nuclease family protein [Spirochaetaceae bacterium]